MVKMFKKCCLWETEAFDWSVLLQVGSDWSVLVQVGGLTEEP